MSVKQLAERDIRESLSIQGKCFIAFRKELNPVMKKLVKNHIKAQQSCQSSVKTV